MEQIHAHEAGASPPGNDERPTGANGRPLWDSENGQSNSALIAALPQAAADRKTIATLRAQLALLGYQLHEIVGEEGRRAWLVSRWDRSRELADVRAIEAFLAHAGGPR
jgi:hypothetical protein